MGVSDTDPPRGRHGPLGSSYPFSLSPERQSGLSIPLDRLALIMMAAREREAEEEAFAELILQDSYEDDEDEDDDEDDEDEEDDDEPDRLEVPQSRQRLIDLARGLQAEQLAELLALAWIGRGDFEPDALAVATVRASKLISIRPAEYLADLPGLADYLDSALTSLGYTVEEEFPI